MFYSKAIASFTYVKWDTNRYVFKIWAYPVSALSRTSTIHLGKCAVDYDCLGLQILTKWIDVIEEIMYLLHFPCFNLICHRNKVTIYVLLRMINYSPLMINSVSSCNQLVCTYPDLFLFSPAAVSLQISFPDNLEFCQLKKKFLSLISCPISAFTLSLTLRECNFSEWILQQFSYCMLYHILWSVYFLGFLCQDQEFSICCLSCFSCHLESCVD